MYLFRALWDRYEVPTWIVAAAIYASWIVLTWFYHDLPLWLAVPAAGFVVCWHGSLQHETIHGHPTRSAAVNTILAAPPLGVFFPYGLYKASHLRHHHDERLTYPFEDPESFYVTRARWDTLPRWRKNILMACNTMLGRLVLGPFVSIGAMAKDEVRRLREKDYRHVRAWLWHIPFLAILFAWASGVCGIAPLAYVCFFALPGLSLTLMRSFAEHQAAGAYRERTVIVRTSPVIRLLYLNNNFHSVHHENPRIPWYKIPHTYEAGKDDFLAGNGRYYFDSYAAQFRRYFLKPKEMPYHPDGQ